MWGDEYVYLMVVYGDEFYEGCWFVCCGFYRFEDVVEVLVLGEKCVVVVDDDFGLFYCLYVVYFSI